MLSPFPGLKKRKQVMLSSVPWLEIDLIHQGESPRDLGNQSDYDALLKRGGPLALFELWHFDLCDGMPIKSQPGKPNFRRAISKNRSTN